MGYLIENGFSLVGDGWSDGAICVSGDRLSATVQDARRINAHGLLVLPGIVDVHGDAFERQIMPRPGVRFDTRMALLDTDRQLVANGITTAFHGVTVSWEPGLRSIDAARAFVRALYALRDRLSCDTRLHLRWETFALDAVAEVTEWLSLTPAPILAFNDHTTGSVLKGNIARKIGQMAERSSLSRDAYMDLLARVWDRRDDVPDAITAMAASARERGNMLLAHDESSPEDRMQFRSLGVHSCEFPLNIETAQAARLADEDVILGAPNVVRGGSHNGALDATEAVLDGHCSVLTSDYHYPSPIHAAFKLADGNMEATARFWPLVSANPARAIGLMDRGSLEPGHRADLILVDAADKHHPEVVATMVKGKFVYMRDLLGSQPALEREPA
ncbi:alpha-D-ribose 1-methylphosphonate 5-triphosphate diphosphatase [Aureimonas glaciei]|uniref:Alpha-D-ribose 1-methylphosphonate 5-triphosphate diphosphatase n=1 Tax=Aureimonas glaciei TaxID=1776957 RepID=A0A916XTT7_9HYPH|nr:alpha-D-ribose 1-methylphosphonate 5-triphosphate diphosphatase [Aureimonas glaciei]GGD08616.1 alpha-D-ribose 1-methylphosphonate 5-triphosphate diphosphatase [Aureimonas glaciei]